MKYQIMAMVPVREPFASEIEAQMTCVQIGEDNPNAVYRIFPVLDKEDEGYYQESERPYISPDSSDEAEEEKLIDEYHEYYPISLIP